MTTDTASSAEPAAPDPAPADGGSAASPALPSWKERLQDPFDRYYRYPIARWLVRYVLIKTPITPNQVSLLTIPFAAAAGWCATFPDHAHLVLAAVLFEIRAILDCADGTLARAKKLSSPWGHAIDAMADWLGVVLLYAGIATHLVRHPPERPGALALVPPLVVVLVSLFQGATRSFASDYYKLKYVSIYEQGADETVETLRRKVLALGKDSSFFAHVDVFIGRMGHLSFEHEWFDPARSRAFAGNDHIRQLKREEGSWFTRFIAFGWSISSGDAYLSMTVLTLVLDLLWPGQVFFATIGLLWIYGFILLNGRFVRGAAARSARPR